MSDVFITVESGKSKRFLTAGRVCNDNIVVKATAKAPPVSGYAAIGRVDATAKKASILAHNGATQIVAYTGNDPSEGTVHRYERNAAGEYVFTYLRGNEHLTPVNPLAEPGMQIFGQPGAPWLWSIGDRLLHYDMRGVPIFIRYSSTLWRLSSMDDLVSNDGGTTAQGYFLDCQRRGDYADADNQRWHSVGALMLGTTDGQGIAAPALTIFGNPEANVVLPIW